MIKEMDQLLTHWAEQHARRSARQRSALAQAMEFGGIPPRGSGVKTSRDPLGLGDLDEVAWEIECALRHLDIRHQVMADEHYRDGGYSDAKAQRLGCARRTYYDRLDRLHAALQGQLREHAGKRRRA